MMKGEPVRTREEAENFLASLAAPDEAWVRHSRNTAKVAFRIAEALRDAGCDIDPEYVCICALLHDVGRSVSHGYLHGWEGYGILKKNGFGAYAKCCVSHWFKGRSKERIRAENVSLDIALFEQEVFDKVGAGTFDLCEKVVALADSLALVDGIVTIDKRYDEAEERYGKSAWISGNRGISHEIKNELSALLSRDIYLLFSDLHR